MDINDNDDSDLDTDEIQRSLSPSPRDPPPPCIAFRKEDLHQQFSYVKPVLVAILNDRYAPGTRHKSFMQGGKARTELTKDAGQKGLFTARDVGQLTKILLRWALRDKAKAEVIQDDQVSQLRRSCLATADVAE